MKDNIKRTKIQVTDWENIFVKDISAKGLFSKIHKGLVKVNNKKQSIKNGQKTLTDTSPKKTYKRIKASEKMSHIIIIREMQIKTAMPFHDMPTQLVNPDPDNIKYQQGCGATGTHSFLAGGMQNSTATLEKTFGGFLQH